VTRRQYDPARAGGPVRELSTRLIKVTDRGIDAVEHHVGRFGHDEANQVMVDRLRRIAGGEIQPSRYDLNFYSHELREFVRYRREGFPAGGGDDYDLWNNTHAAALEDYGLPELDDNGDRTLFHPDAWPFLPR
jgi:hypothetical protein